MKHLYDSLRPCAKEEEVKAEFCKFFKMKIFALRGIDHYTEHVLFEFKYDRNFRNPESVARVLAQVMYYARLLKYGAGLTKYPLPPYICVVDKNEAFFAETKDYAKFYATKSDRYDWDRAPSTPCPKLVTDVLHYLTQRRGGAESGQTNLPYIYDLTNPAEEEQFVEKCREHLIAQMTFLELLEKNAITEDNFLDVFDYWDGLFGPYVRNGRKSSEYFLSDIEQGKSIVAQDGQVLFSVSGAEGYIPKTLQPEKYKHFWQNYEKVPPPGMTRIRQKADRLTEDFRRRFTGEFYTPVEFAAKGLDYLARTVGKEWWKSGEYRFWDMAAGTGNLEFELPSSAPYANAGAFSVTPENFEKAMVLHAVKKIPKATWTNDRDAFYAPTGGRPSSAAAAREDTRPPCELPSEFVADCVVWSAFADSNYAVSLRNVQYQGRVWQIANQMFPFLLEEVRRWPCAHGDIAAQLAAANEDRFLAKWLDARGGRLSPAAVAVLDAARVLYRAFYANITHTPWMDWEIETWDVGYYQVRNAMKGLCDSASLREKHDTLRAKLLPQVYSLGFLNPDVEYFK